MKREKDAQIYSDLSLICFLAAVFLAIASFFYQAQMWYFISGICLALGLMKYADAAKEFTCENNRRRGRVDLISAIVFTLAAIALFFTLSL